MKKASDLDTDKNLYEASEEELQQILNTGGESVFPSRDEAEETIFFGKEDCNVISDSDLGCKNESPTEKYHKLANIAFTESKSRGAVTESEDIVEICNDSFIESYVFTRKGGRAENQDTAAFRNTQRGMLLAVCDGMGGGPAGKRASVLAASTILNYVADHKDYTDDSLLLSDAIQMAHEVVKYDVSIYPQNTGMGTTAAVLLINEEVATIAHVGDSRVYQTRGNKCVFRTTDHSLVARKMQIEGWTDEEARTSAESNIITQAIGHGDIEAETEIRPYLKGDRFLLCTDGIWGHYPQPELLKILGDAPTPMGAMSDLMVTTDNIGIMEGNHHDNFTAIMLRCNINSIQKEKMTKKAKIIIIVLGFLLAASIVVNLIQCYGNKEGRTEEKIAPARDTLTIVSQMEPASDAVVTATPEKKRQQKAKDTVYIVREGDRIGKIAVKFKVSEDLIREANPDIEDDLIKVGQKLRIPLMSE